MIHLQHLTIALSLIFLLGCSSAKPATKCHQDNCYRALFNRPSAAISFCHTFTNLPDQPIPTVNPPPFTSQCHNSPPRLSSACSCLFPSPTTPTSSPSPSPTGSVGVCAPTPPLDVNRNGNFDINFVPTGPVDLDSLQDGKWHLEHGAAETLYPWYFDRMNASRGRGDFIRLPKNKDGSTETGGVGAAFHINANIGPCDPLGYAPCIIGYLNIPVSVCANTIYTVSFWGRLYSPSPNGAYPSCWAQVQSRLTSWRAGGELSTGDLVDYGRWYKFGGYISEWPFYSNSYNPIIDPVVHGVGNEGTRYAERGNDFGNGRGWRGWGWNDTISIQMRCFNVEMPFTAVIDSVRIEVLDCRTGGYNGENICRDCRTGGVNESNICTTDGSF